MAEDIASWALVFFTSVLALATIWYAFETRKHAKLQKEELNFQEKAFNEEKKPVLFISPSIGSDIFYIWLANLSRVPAKDIIIEAWFRDKENERWKWPIPSLLPGRAYQFNEAFKIPEMQEGSDEFIVKMTYKGVDDTPYEPERIVYKTNQWLKMKGRVKAESASSIVTDVMDHKD